MDTNSKMKLQIKKKLKKASDKKQDYNFDCLDFLDSQSLFEEYCRYQNKRTSNKDSALAESENLEFSPFDLLNLKQQVAKLQKKPIPKTKPLSTLNKKISSPTTNEKSKQRQKITSGSRIASTQKTSFREEKTQSKLLQPKVQTLQRKNSTVEYSVNTQCQTVSNFSPTASSIKSSKRPRDLRVYESKQLSSPFSDKQDNKSPVHFSQDFPIVEVYEIDIDSGDDKALNEQKSSVERSKENLSSIQIKKKLDRKELNKKSKILISNRKSSKGSVYQEQRKKPYVMSLCPVLGKKKNDQTPAKKVLKGSTQTNVSPFKCDKKRGLEELEKKQKQLGIYSSRNGDPSNSLAAKLSINNIQRQLTTSRTKNSVQSNFEAYQSNAERGIKSPPQLRKKVPLSFDLSNSRRIDSMKSISNEISSDIKVKKRSIKEMDLRQVAQLACQKAKKKVELLEDVENYLSSQENLRFDGQKSNLSKKFPHQGSSRGLKGSFQSSQNSIFKTEDREEQTTLRRKKSENKSLAGNSTMKKLGNQINHNGDLHKKSSTTKGSHTKTLAHSSTQKAVGQYVAMSSEENSERQTQEGQNEIEFFINESSTSRLTSDLSFPTIVVSAESIGSMLKDFNFYEQKQMVSSFQIQTRGYIQDLMQVQLTLNDQCNKKGFKQFNNSVNSFVVVDKSVCDSLQEKEIQSYSQTHLRILKNRLINQQQIDKENNNVYNNYSSDKNENKIALPIDFLFIKAQFSSKNDSSVISKIDILAPNIQFDFYQISSLQINSSQILQIQTEQFQTGYLKIDNQTKIQALSPQDSSYLRGPLVGLWFRNLPELSNSNPQLIIKHPLVWAQCLKFVLMSDQIEQIYSPSSDKNTFLVVNFDEDKTLFYEFKLVRNEQDKQYLNNWVVVSINKHLHRDEDLVLKCQVFKKPEINYQKYRVYQYKKFLERIKNKSSFNEVIAKGQDVKLKKENTERSSQSKANLKKPVKRHASEKQIISLKDSLHKEDSQSKQDSKEYQIQQPTAKNSSRNISSDLKKVQSVHKIQTMKEIKNLETDSIENLKYRSQVTGSFTPELDDVLHKSQPSYLINQQQFIQISNNNNPQSKPKLNIGKFVPNLRMSQQIKQQNQNSQTRQNDAQALINSQRENENILLTSHQPSASISQRPSILSPCQKQQMFQTTNHKNKFQSRNGSVYQNHNSHDAVSRHEEQGLVDYFSSPKLAIPPSIMKTVDHQFVEMQQEEENQDKKLVKSNSNLQNPLNSCFNQEKKSVLERFSELPKRLDFSENINLKRQQKQQENKDYTDAIQKCQSSPTSKEIMLEQAKTIRLLQQQVQDLQKMIIDMQSKNGNNSKSNQSGISSSTAGSRSIDEHRKHQNRSNEISDKCAQQYNSQPMQQNFMQQNEQYIVPQPMLSLPPQPPQTQQHSYNQTPMNEIQVTTPTNNENQLISAFVDFLRSSHQNSGLQNIMQQLYKDNPQNKPDQNEYKTNQNICSPTNNVQEAFKQYEHETKNQRQRYFMNVQSSQKLKESSQTRQNDAYPPPKYEEMKHMTPQKEQQIIEKQMQYHRISNQNEVVITETLAQRKMLDNCQESPIMNATSISDTLNSRFYHKGDNTHMMNQKEESQYLKQLNNLLISRIQDQDFSVISNLKPTKVQEFKIIGQSVFGNGAKLAKIDEDEDFYERKMQMMNQQRRMLMRKESNGGHQADDEDDTIRESDISLAILGKKKL